MESFFKQISKHTNKIIRILTKITEQYPKLSQQIDLALYAAIKIEKAVTKLVQSSAKQTNLVTQSCDYKLSKGQDTQDAFFTSAVECVQQFRNNTFRLQRKINVLINEQQKPNFKHKDPGIFSNVQVKKKGFKKKLSKVESNRESESDASSNLSSLDADILRLTEQIRRVYQEQENQVSKNL